MSQFDNISAKNEHNSKIKRGNPDAASCVYAHTRWLPNVLAMCARPQKVTTPREMHYACTV